MPKDIPASLPIDVTDYETLGCAAKLLGKSKNFVARAVEKGLLRSTSEPFKSNLNGGSNAKMVLVNLQDVRDALIGKIDLSTLDAPRKVTRKSLPSDMTELAEMIVNMTQTLEQLAVMVATIIETLNATPAAKKRKETPSDMV